MLLTLLDCLLGNSRSSHSTLACFLGTLIAASAAAQLPPPPLDLDRDGVPDIVIRQVRANPAEPVWGRIVVVSGAGGGGLLSVVGPEANDLFGWVAASIGDIDGDGVPDLAVAAPRGRTPLPEADPQSPPAGGALGRVHLVAGADGSILRSIGVSDFGYFGFALRTVRDFDGDGMGELLISGVHFTGEQTETGPFPLTPFWVLASTFTGDILMRGEGPVGAPFRAPFFPEPAYWKAGQVRGPRTYDFGFAGDVDADGDVDFADLMWLLSNWGGDGGPRSRPNLAKRGDMDGSGAIGFSDLVTILGQFGRTAGDPPLDSDLVRWCWDPIDPCNCAVEYCPIFCPDPDDTVCSGGPCGCCDDPVCCNDPCCQSGDPCSAACGGPCSPGCLQASPCICDPCHPSCGGCGEGPYPCAGNGTAADPCDCDDDGDGTINREDADSTCYAQVCAPGSSGIGHLVITVPARIRLEHEGFQDPTWPKKTPIVWTNTDDDNGNGIPDCSESGPEEADVHVDFEDDLIPVRFAGTFCGTDKRWWIQSPGNLWYAVPSESDPDLRDEVIGEPWPLDDVLQKTVGGNRLRLIVIPPDMLPPVFQGDPRAWSGKIFYEPTDPSPGLTYDMIHLVYGADPLNGGERKVKWTVLPIAALELQVHDLQHWGPQYHAATQAVSLEDEEFECDVSSPQDPDCQGRPVGGAVTDGASICLLRLLGPVEVAAAPLNEMTIAARKRDPGSAQQGLSSLAVGPEIGGSIVPFIEGQPVLPSLPITDGHASASIEASLSGGMAFYVPPESYIDPTHLPPAPPGALPNLAEFHNSSETCLVTFECRIDDLNIPGGRSFILRRPPLVLVHGLWSSAGTWEASVWNESLFHTRLYKVDYSGTADKGYDTNWHKVPSMIEAALVDHRTGIGGIKYAATRADVVAHSMGGVLTRVYISGVARSFTRRDRYVRHLIAANEWVPQDSLSYPPFQVDRYGAPETGKVPYLRSDNFGAGSIRRFLTVGTPFNGSKWAQYICDNWEATVEIIEVVEAGIQLVTDPIGTALKSAEEQHQPAIMTFKSPYQNEPGRARAQMRTQPRVRKA